MAEKNTPLKDIPKEKFEFANTENKISDKKFDTKPIGYMKDAWLRFKKNKASVAAAIIILFIVLYAIFAPLLIGYDATFMDVNYAKKGPRNVTLRQIGIADGGTTRDFSERALVRARRFPSKRGREAIISLFSKSRTKETSTDGPSIRQK